MIETDAFDIETLRSALAPSLAEDWPGLFVDHASGVYLYTADGRRVLDFTSGIGVTNTGHCHPAVVEAATLQLQRLMHSAVGVTYNQSLAELTTELRKVLPEGLDTFFFGNSGAEAVEGALKLARYVTRRPGIIAFQGGFHGRTYGAASITSVKAKYRNRYEPFIGSVYFSPFADPYHGSEGLFGDESATGALGALQRLLAHVVPADQVAAIIVEPIQGEAGYIVPPRRFLQGLRELADEIGALLIFDEVQTGFGRTGEMFASQAFGVTPDVLAIAKGIASGLPLAATVASSRLMAQWTAGSHGTTFGGNPVSAAAAVATLKVFRTEDLIENCRAQGSRLASGLRGVASRHPIIGDVRGMGLMQALEFAQPTSQSPSPAHIVDRFLDACLERDLLLYSAGTSGETARLIPPLTVTSDQIDIAVRTIEAALDGLDD